MDQILKIGNFELNLPPEHKLPYYLELFPQYDFRYWGLIESLCAENNWKNISLVDIGANVGDSAAHFRSFSEGVIQAYEPSEHYFDYLQKNTTGWKNIQLFNAIISSPTFRNRIKHEAYDGTGATFLSDGAEYEGECILTPALIDKAPEAFIIKSDTDGFDGHLVHSLGVAMKNKDKFARIVTFEGPTTEQGLTGDIDVHTMAVRTLQSSGYLVQILSNIGTPIAYVGSDFEAFKWQINSWMLKLKNQDFTCQYFDFICVHKDASTKTFNFVPPADP